MTIDLLLSRGEIYARSMIPPQRRNVDQQFRFDMRIDF